MSEPIHIISLGAGVQSSVMSLMAAKGEITPMPQCAIFADTQAEPKSVYTWLDWLEKQLPFPVHRVTAGALWGQAVKHRVNRTTSQPYYKPMVPAFVATATGRGMLRRACTWDFKMVPIVREARRISKAHKAEIVQWIGISTDEASRMKPSREPSITHRWPLIDMGMNRTACLEWWSVQGHAKPPADKPPKSACVFCPYHHDDQWSDMKRNHPKEFDRAVEFEKQMQASFIAGGAKVAPFLHPTLKPLSEVVFSTLPSHQQVNLFNNECEGMCGV